MSLVVLPALIPDILRIYQIYFDAFRADKMGALMLRILFPDTLDDQDFRKAHAAGTLSYWHLSDCQYTFKVVDTVTGGIIGMGLGDAYLRERTAAERANHGVPWLEGEQRARAEKVLNPLWDVRERLFGGRRYISKLFSAQVGRSDANISRTPFVPDCHVITIDPQHQGRKAGALIVQWGVDLGESAGLPVYFESSPSTVGLYKRMGFEVLDEQIVHDAALLGTDEDIVVPLMVRMPACAGGMTFKEWRETGYPEFAKVNQLPKNETTC